MLERNHALLAADMEIEQQAMPDLDSVLDDDIGDELLRLIFTACHPLLSREGRVALALRMICGLTTEEIARAFLLPVYERFTEGFETADLKEANALLEQLNRQVRSA